jgi:hypothetical protein
MQRKLVLLAGFFLLVFGCNKTSNPKTEPTVPEEETFTATQRQCASYDILQEQLNNDPALKTRMEAIEEFTKRIADNPDASRLYLTYCTKQPHRMSPNLSFSRKLTC